MPHTHTVGSIGRSAFWSVLNQMVGQILVLAVFLVTARFVSKEAFGIMATCMLAVELFRQVLIESIGTTFYAKKSPSDDDYNAGFFIVAVGGTVSAALVFLLAKPAANFFNHGDIASSLQWISAILLTIGLSKMHEIWLTKHLKFKVLALRSISSICLGGGIGIVMAINGYGLASLITQQIVTAIASLVWLWLASPWRPSLKIHWTNIASILKYWKFFALTSIAGLISGQSDVFFASYYLGAAATGIYNAAKRLLLAVSLISGAGFNNVALPAMTTFSADKGRLQSSFLTCISLTTLLTAPLYAGLAIMSSDIVHILMGTKWAEVTPILSILAVTGFISSLSQYSSNIILIEHKAHWQTVLGFISAVTNVLLLFVFARYGLAALALALATRILIFAPIVTGLALHLLQLKAVSYLRKIAFPIVFAIFMACFVTYGRQQLGLSHIANLIVFVPAGAAIYFLLFYIFDRASLAGTVSMFMETVRKTAKEAPVTNTDAPL